MAKGAQETHSAPRRRSIPLLCLLNSSLLSAGKLCYPDSSPSSMHSWPFGMPVCTPKKALGVISKEQTTARPCQKLVSKLGR